MRPKKTAGRSFVNLIRGLEVKPLIICLGFRDASLFADTIDDINVRLFFYLEGADLGALRSNFFAATPAALAT
jgi:hypothetical protein